MQQNKKILIYRKEKFFFWKKKCFFFLIYIYQDMLYCKIASQKYFFLRALLLRFATIHRDERDEN